MPAATRLWHPEAIARADARGQALGPPGELMRRAGRACWQHLENRFPTPARLCVVAGPGNNGGDGWVVAMLARQAGWQVAIVTYGRGATAGDAADARRAYEQAAGREEIQEGLSGQAALPACEVVVDALFGTGLARDLDAPARALVEAIVHRRQAGAYVLAVDLPSGLDAATGRLFGAAVEADATLTFIGLKTGLFTGQAPAHTGQVTLVTLELPEEIFAAEKPSARLLEPTLIARELPPRSRTSHKGTNGHVLVVAGGPGTAGAALMASRATLRAGAGLVSLATHPSHAALVAMAQPEVMAHGIATGHRLAPLLDKADAVVCGPGLGQHAWGKSLLRAVLKSKKPLLLDADALNLVASAPQSVPRGTVLTPHPGEAARLLGGGTTVPMVEADRYAALARLSTRFPGCAIVLKGAGSLVSASDGPPWVCPFGNPGMGTGGMGDTLSGIGGAFLATRADRPFEAAALAVLVHARAGDAAAEKHGERGLLPSDLIDALGAVVNP